MYPLKLSAGIITTLAISAAIAFALHAGMALAQSDATSTDPIVPASDASSTTPDAPPSPDAASSDELAAAPPASPPSPLSLVSIVGKKYIDYFIDGTTTVSFPGDPVIDANLDKPDAPIPTHGDLKWDHTISVDEYDTATGDLGVNEYALLSDGTYRVHLPASHYKDATSTAEFPDRIVTVDVDPTTPPRKTTPSELTTSTALDASTTADNATTTL